MGRTEPSAGRPPAGFRRDARAKRAKATINKVIPAVLAAHPRARKGVDASELIVDPPPLSHDTPPPHGQKPGRKGHARDRDEGKEPSAEERSRKNPRVALQVADTLTAAYSLLLVPTSSSSSSSSSEQRRDLSNKEARVGILNMASPLSPGGGFLNGAASQEESLCGRTTLLPALRDEFYRLPELGVVFTPDVLAFRRDGAVASNLTSANNQKPIQHKTRNRRERSTMGRQGEPGGQNASSSQCEYAGFEEEGAEAEAAAGNSKRGGEGGEDPVIAKSERWFVDVVSAAMLRMPEIDIDEGSGWASYASAGDRELAVRKMRAVMRVFSAKGVRRVVLGAWGCGAYGNPVGEIARAWRKVLLGPSTTGGGQKKGKGGKKENAADSWESIEDVVFAIKDEGMARAFAAAFGEDLLELRDCDETDLSEDDEEEEEEEGEDVGIRELRDKVREMELRIGQARTPQLRAGLNSVLAGLRSQLPGGRESDQHPSQRSPTSHRSSSDEVSEVEGDVSEEESDADDQDRSGHCMQESKLK
ncbi:pyruvate dehydrogenase complex dihydrolipoamide acetyltransferase component (E2) [Hypoxylon texense]